jgi:hypothetical protein
LVPIKDPPPKIIKNIASFCFFDFLLVVKVSGNLLLGVDVFINTQSLDFYEQNNPTLCLE